MSDEPFHPADLALLLLASGDLLPRQRARDQQADLAGNELKRHMLNELVVADPEPAEIESALATIIDSLDQPTGPARAIALSVLDDWRAAQESPEFVEWLVTQAVAEGQQPAEGRRRGRKNRQLDQTPDTGAA